MKINEDEFLERLAELEHDQWIELIRYLSKQGVLSDFYMGYCNDHGLFKSYSQLTEKQKESDRSFARKVMTLLEDLTKDKEWCSVCGEYKLDCVCK